MIEKTFFQKISRTANMGLRDKESEVRSVGDLAFKFFERDLPMGQRIQSLLALLGKVIPNNISDNIINILESRDLKNIPFRLSTDKVVGIGFTSDVYLLESQVKKQKNYVVKINFCQSCSDLNTVIELAKKNRCEFENIRRYYTSVKDLIPEEYVVIGSAKNDRRFSIMTIQEFFGLNIKDFFSDFSKNELIEIINNDEELKINFIEFSEKTFYLEKNKGISIDFIGHKNLVIIEDENKKNKLRFIDPHGIFLLSDAKRKKWLYAKLDYIRDVYKLVK